MNENEPKATLLVMLEEVMLEVRLVSINSDAFSDETYITSDGQDMFTGNFSECT